MTSIVVLAGAIGAGDGIRSRAAENAARAERFRLQAELLEEGVRASADAERRQLARDVHDVLGHAMVVVTTQANVALEATDDPALVRSSLTAIKATAQQALREIRGSLAVLSGGAAESRHPVGSLDDLDALAARFAGTDLIVQVERDPHLPDVPAAVGSTAYRVVQEALTNAIRHGGAGRVTITVRQVADELAVDVRDDGRGAVDFTPGHGLTGMRERIGMLGGRLEAGPAPGGGFTVSARMPLSRSGGA